MRYILYGLLMIPAVIFGAVFSRVLYRWIRYGYGFGFHKTPQEKEEEAQEKEEEARRCEEEEHQYLENLKNPDFSLLEKVWEHPFPAPLKVFYQDKASMIREGIGITLGAVGVGACILPSVQEDFEVGLKTLVDDDLIVEGFFSLADTANDRYRSIGYFPFAHGCLKRGGVYEYVIDPRLDDPEVILIEDGNKKWKYPLGVNLSTFLSALRKIDKRSSTQSTSDEP
jgi:hypothetical protein